MVRNIAFIEALADSERRRATDEWREALAGLLVVRLYQLCRLEPAVAARDAPPTVAVRHVVTTLSHAPIIRDRLRSIVDALGGRRRSGPRQASQLLEEYAAALASRGRTTLARDVWDTVEPARSLTQRRRRLAPAPPAMIS